MLHIPRPCSRRRDALTPTAAGFHCAACATEVVDFTRMGPADILTYLAARPGQRVCGILPAGDPPRPRRPAGLRRWLLALAALLTGPRLALAQVPGDAPPPLKPTHGQPRGREAARGPVVVRGVVLDDSLNVPIPGAQVFVRGTKYGAVTDERGEFVLSFSPNWPPARAGQLLLDVSANPFAFEEQSVVATFAGTLAPPPLTVRLKSRPGRGFIVGRVVPRQPPVPPPAPARKRGRG